MEPLRITFDGASRGNPGSGSSAAVLWRGAERIADKAYRHPRHVTNNEAEYGGLLAGLELAAESAGDPASVRLVVEGDSKLVIEHVFGKWKCKCPRLQPLQRRARELVGKFKAVEGRWIPRERNGAADALCNKVFDAGVAQRTPPFTATPPIAQDIPWPAPKRDTPRPQAARRRTILEQLAM
jgi:ribonuclease HI